MALLEPPRADHCLPGDSQLASCRSWEALRTPKSQVPGLTMNEEMKAQRGVEPCPRSPSKWYQSWG